jgi:signal transduction histidine kinase
VAITQGAIDDARKIMTDLRPSMLDDLGILVTIRWLCRTFGTIYPEIQIEQAIGVEEADIPEPFKIIIFRVIQEALNNIAKYSKAKQVNLSLMQEDGKIQLLISDKGLGFDVAAVSKQNDCAGGLGLTSMKERVELSGGVFLLQSAPNKGTTIHASWAVSLGYGGGRHNP